MNIFIANLNFKIQSDYLREVFEEYGTVSSAKIITDKKTGRSKGYGFVEMDDDEEARKAIQGLNGQELEGRSIVVEEAKPREDAQSSQ